MADNNSVNAKNNRKMPLKKGANKSSAQEKNAKTSNTQKASKGSTAATMKMTMSPASSLTPRLHHKKVMRVSGKRPGAHRTISGKGRPCARQTVDTCENSDDSGLGFDHSMDIHSRHYSDRHTWIDDVTDIKRRKIDLKFENDETNDNYCFPENVKVCKDNTTIIRTIPNTGIQNLSRAVNQSVNPAKVITRGLPLSSRRVLATNGQITLTTQLQNSSRNGKVHLQIVSQPEQQHRARYQTEGSRGAVKDRSGSSFPIVKLIGYDKPTTLQVFIGTDQGRVAPHMFYQACRVSGKNSTPCTEKKIDGTVVIEVELDPTKEMIATCDCVGILKERNVDVEHRFPEQIGSRNKKKSTRCRMIFRAGITNDDGTSEVLQACSQPIVCTQPPGVPEICKKSLTSCPATGGLELFILGKNFLKDTKVVFQANSMFDSPRDPSMRWEEYVTPDKEFLQQTHLVCVVPPYLRHDITEPVTVRLFVISSGKNSDPQSFVYTPAAGPSVRMDTNPTTSAPFLSKMLWNTGSPKTELNIGMMPPPSTLVPMAQRRPSALLDNHHSPPLRSMKTEMVDENSQGSVMDHMMSDNSMDSIRHRFRPISESSMDVHQEESNIAMINENSMDMLRRQEFINENSNISVVNDNSIDINIRNNFHCEKSNHSVHNEDSGEAIRSPVVAETMIMPAPVLVPSLVQSELRPNTLTANDLKGIDLRMKCPTINDLADTQPPSMATLLKFGVTEPTNMPLPTQTGQSVENFFLTTLENPISKPVLSNSVANNSNMKTDTERLIEKSELLETKGINAIMSQQIPLSELLNTEQQNVPGTNKIFNEQVMNNSQELSGTLLTNGTVEIIPNLNESHIKTNFDHNIVSNGHMIFNPPVATNQLMSKADQTEVLKNEADLIMSQALNSTMLPATTAVPTEKETNLILSQQSLQAALNTNLLPVATATPKLDALVNSTVESHIGSPIRSPQHELISNSPQEMKGSPILQPPEIMISPTPDVLLNPQAPLLSSTISPRNELLIHSPQNDMSHSDVILNTQVSPSVICPQEALLGTNLNTICPSNALDTCLQTNQLQPEMIRTETELHSSPSTIISNHLNLGIKVTMPNDCLVISPGTEMPVISPHIIVEQKTQQQMIQQIFDSNTTPTQEVMLIKNIFNQQQFVETNTQINNVIVEEKSNANEFISPQESVKPESVKQIPEQPAKPCPEIINSAITMSDNDLINYINPSCFDAEVQWWRDIESKKLS